MTATTHDVKPAAAVLADDVICQSFVQSSSTLAYACLLIRAKKYELAGHVLHSLEAKQASRFKDMVFYLQAQIGIETGEFATVKKRLVPRVNLQPNDMVALSLLECCVHLEWLAAQGSPTPPSVDEDTHEQRAVAAPKAQERQPALSVPSLAAEIRASLQGESPAQIVSHPAFAHAPGNLPVTAPAAAAPAAAAPAAPSQPTAVSPFVAPAAPRTPPAAPAPAPNPVSVQPPSAAALSAGASAISAADPGEFAPYQTLLANENAQAMSLWNGEQNRYRAVTRVKELEPVMAMLPECLPGDIAISSRNLDAGEVYKICFAFEHLTLTSLHAGSEHLDLVTGPLNQSLLTMVRAENIFFKSRAAGAGSAVRSGFGTGQGSFGR